MPLRPSSFFGAFQTTRCLVNFVPFQPLQARTCHLGPLPTSVPAVTYSVPLCQTTPAANAGPGSFVGVPFLTAQTPPFGGPLWLPPPSPTNIVPAPNANEVGVGIPLVTS